ncbi:cobalamin biosynthesis protein CobW [Roseivirga misakiensis]|uniref:Cobalamin biosynthesis protein CobW n=2 Tax=Roseivirga misakiensis TaxID=1563681 RepID=A0A1E5T2L6_9BACT|nr:cobalamin biosynthesis protein CobW [Roseivirga misakiensis]
MEGIITVVGFLGAGKTTLLKHLTTSAIAKGLQPYIILNDYENAGLDAQQFLEQLNPSSVNALNGSCICCSGIGELRNLINNVPKRPAGITLIEANGTSDACALMGFLGVGVDSRFLSPIQISVVDVMNWQRRGEHNVLEANQIQVSSLVVLTHLDECSKERRLIVENDIRRFNPLAKIITTDQINVTLLSKLEPSDNQAEKLDHLKAHWSSSSTDLPILPNKESIFSICNALPRSILRVKGCARLKDDEGYTYFERTPDGKVSIRPFHGIPTTGAKLLTVGPGSDIKLLNSIIEHSLKGQEV